MKKRHLTFSIIIHSVIIFFVVFLSSTFMSDNKRNNMDALMVSISGSPDLSAGKGNGLKKEHASNKNTSTTDAPSGRGSTIIEGGNTTSGQGGGTGSTATSYTGSILQKIQEYKYYPISAKKNKLTGMVKIRFTVLNDGTLKDGIKILISSGHEILDETAIKIVKNSAPFSLFPQEIKEKELNLVVNIDFSI